MAAAKLETLKWGRPGKDANLRLSREVVAKLANLESHRPKKGVNLPSLSLGEAAEKMRVSPQMYILYLHLTYGVYMLEVEH